MRTNAPTLSFFAEGDPAPQGSKSRTRYGGMYESSARLKTWRESVAWAARLARHEKRGGPYLGEVTVVLDFGLRIDADVDKLCRGVLDGLTDGGMIEDDRQVRVLIARKRKAPKGERGCAITVTEEADLWLTIPIASELSAPVV